MPKLIALRVEIGTHFPAVQTSQGKVLLAALPADQVAAALSQPSRSGLPSCIDRSPDQLRDELTEVRARGWALAEEELAPGVRSVAVPVRDGTGTVRAGFVADGSDRDEAGPIEARPGDEGRIRSLGLQCQVQRDGDDDAGQGYPVRG